jgi:hypothetical protein
LEGSDVPIWGYLKKLGRAYYGGGYRNKHAFDKQGSDFKAPSALLE